MMVESEKSELVQAFLEDHRTLMRGLAALLKNVEAADLPGARRQADELDRAAGSHIQFEEEVLYPEVGRVRGQELERDLRKEHSIARQAIQRILKSDPQREKAALICDEVGSALRTAVRHAESCGTLISHLKALPPEAQQQALERLRAFRRQGRRWTEFSETRKL